MTRIVSLAAAMGLFAAVGCDVENDREIHDELIDAHDDDDQEELHKDPDPGPASQELAACDWLGADRTCGEDGVQFCAWLYNEDTAEVSTYWGECIEEPECTLWSCRDDDEALCDLVDGKPQWVPHSCSW